MAIKMKGIYKGFKYISNIFVVKDREIEIGYPTDVKHVAHIGWDGQSDSAPTWMSTYKSATTFSAAPANDLGASRSSKAVEPSSWSSRDFEQSNDCQQNSDQTIKKNTSLTDRPKPAKKQRRKKIKSAASSPKSSSTSRASRVALSKSSFNKSMSQLEPAQNLHGSAQSIDTLS